MGLFSYLHRLAIDLAISERTCVYFKIIIILISNTDTLFHFEWDDNLLIADQNFK
jgi:hypothetical protein